MRHDHNTDDMPLLHWTPPRSLLLFPLAKRVGKIRRTAAKLVTKETAKHEASYRGQVTDCLLATMKHTDIDDAGKKRELQAFWVAVECERCRLAYIGLDDGRA